MLTMRRATVLVLSILLLAGAALAQDAPQVKVKPGHPKVMLTKGDIDRVGRNIKADTANWRALKAQVDAGTAALPVYGLVYLATGDEAVGKKGVEALLSDKTAKAMNAENYEDAALAYDWLYPLLTEDQRKMVFERVKAAISKDLAFKMDAPWTNFVQRSSMRIAIAGCAFASEFPEAQSWVDKAYTDWETFHLPAIKLVEQGGGWPEGTLYSYIVYSSLTRLADTFWTATDKNPYEETRWFTDRLGWFRFHTWPLPKDFHGRAFYMYDPYGDSEKWRAPMENQEIGAEFLVMRYVDEGVAASIESLSKGGIASVSVTDFGPGKSLRDVQGWRWYMRQLRAPLMSLSDWTPLAYYEDSSADMNLVESNAPLSWYATGTGQIFIRSSWLPDATWIMYQCGPRFTYHQHLDQGQFNIFKMGDLTGESGVYEPSGPSDQEGHLQGYASRAIAHNTINVYNPKEVFAGYRSGNSPRNDGGERTWQPFSNTAGSAAKWQEGFDKGAYDTGRITEFKDSGSVVYIASDLTGAYNSDKYVSGQNTSKVHEVTRQLVYFRPRKSGDLDALVVFDRVRATDPSFEKRVLLHFPNYVRVAGKETKTAEGEFTFDGNLAQADTGGGRLFIRSVYPKDVKINKVGGPGKEYWVYGKNFPVPNTPWERGYGEWRLELMPAKAQADDCFLTVYFPSDKSATTAPTIRRVAGKDTLGVDIFREGDKVPWHARFATTGEMGAIAFAGSVTYLTNRDEPAEQFGNKAVTGEAKADGTIDSSLPCPTIADVKVSDVTTTATVTWKTTESVMGYVEFGDTPEMKFIVDAGDKPAKEHKAVLRGLEPSKSFYVRATAKDAQGNTGFSPMLTLTTPEDKTAPVLSGVKVSAVNPTDATVAWSTDDNATGNVTAVDPSGAKVTAQTAASAADQSVMLAGLKPDTEYTVTVAAKNSGGLESTGEPLKVKTPKVMDGFLQTSFEDGNLDAWQPMDASAWKVEKDNLSGATALFLSNEKRARTVTVYKGADYGDFTLRVRARTMEGDGNAFRDYCVVFGYQDPGNYYAAWMCGGVDESLPGIVRVKDGKWGLVGTRPNLVTLPGREWHDITVVRKGAHIEVFFDGAMAFEADDSTFGKGRIGFGSNNDSAAFTALTVIPQAEFPSVAPSMRTKKTSVEGLVIE